MAAVWINPLDCFESLKKDLEEWVIKGLPVFPTRTVVLRVFRIKKTCFASTFHFSRVQDQTHTLLWHCWVLLTSPWGLLPNTLPVCEHGSGQTKITLLSTPEEGRVPSCRLVPPCGSLKPPRKEYFPLLSTQCFVAFHQFWSVASEYV